MHQWACITSDLCDQTVRVALCLTDIVPMIKWMQGNAIPLEDKKKLFIKTLAFNTCKT